MTTTDVFNSVAECGIRNVFEVPRQQILYAMNCRKSDMQGVTRLSGGNRSRLNQPTGEITHIVRQVQRFQGLDHIDPLLSGNRITRRTFLPDNLRNQQAIASFRHRPPLPGQHLTCCYGWVSVDPPREMADHGGFDVNGLHRVKSNRIDIDLARLSERAMLGHRFLSSFRGIVLVFKGLSMIAARCAIEAIVVITALASTSVAVEETVEQALQRFTVAFHNLDGDQDKSLNLNEFLRGRTDVPVATRDYRMADSDDNEKLTLPEFLTIPVVVPLPQRGPLPDIITGLVDQIVAALDAACDDWHKTPERELDARQFTSAIASQMGGSQVMRINQREVDPDANNKVTRAEARRFIEIQMGVRRSDGKLLRQPNGCVVNLMLYQYADLNKDDKLDQKEFTERTYGDPAHVAKEFTAADRDTNGFVSFDEWVELGGRAVRDTVEEFRQFDTNLDARVDPQELLKGTPDWQQPMARHVFPAFDWNKDGLLSLVEYRTTMQANSVAMWQEQVIDRNGSDTIELTEFTFDTLRQFALLRMMYFQRLDGNANKKLDPDEWDFRVRTADAFYIMNADGTGWRRFFEFQGYKACGSPAVSPDGKSIAFDAYSVPNGTPTMYLMSIDGGQPQTIGTGSMPSWAPDGNRLVCSRNDSTSGVWMFTKKDNAWTPTNLTEGGWGAQWSPDGKSIVFTDGPALKLYDVESKVIRDLIEAAASPYQHIYWNLGWSPDSTQVCFKAATPAGSQDVATFDVTKTKPSVKVRHTGRVAINADFAWHPTENRVIFAMFCDERKTTQLYEFDPTNDDKPKLVEGQDPKLNNTDSCWTSDGKQLIIISGDY